MSVDAGTAALVALRTRVQALHEALDAVTGDGGDEPAPGAAAELRDAATRLAALLGSLRAVLDPQRTDAARDQLTALATTAGEVRDADALADLLAGLLAGIPRPLVTGPVGDRIRHRLRERRALAADALAKAVRAEATVACVRGVDALVITPPLTDAASRKAAPMLARAARGDDDRLGDAVAAVRAAASDPERERAWSDVRGTALALACSADAAAGEHGKKARKLAAAADVLAARVDDVDDTVRARRLLVDLADAAHRGREPGFVYGLLHAEAARRGDSARVDAEDALAELAEGKLHSWMR